MRTLIAIAFLLVAATAAAQEFPGDPGPPYQFKVLDLIYRIDDLGQKIEDLVVKETETEIHVELAADVLFDFDRAELLPKAQETLQKAADFVKEHNSGAVVTIEGHTDARGSDSYNEKLSLRRAESVRTWFSEHGLAGTRFSVAGFGAKKPIAPNQKADGSDDPDGRQKNRRVEIVIRKK